MAGSVQSAHYARYVELLNQLHALVRAGEGDGPKADALRDAMDEPWRHLGKEETAAANRLSTQLYSQDDAAAAENRSTRRHAGGRWRVGGIKLLIADDHEVVRCGLRSLLADTDVEIIAEVGTGEDAVRYALENDPDVVLLDIRMPGGDGLTALGRIKLDKPEMPILMLSTFDNPTYIARSVALGASGYVLKGCSRDDLLKAIGIAASGESAWIRDELRRVTGALATPRLAGDVEVPLTQRESEVLRQLAYGLTNKEIAQALHISYETVKEHIQHILRKIGVSDRTQAAVWAVRKELV